MRLFLQHDVYSLDFVTIHEEPQQRETTESKEQELKSCKEQDSRKRKSKEKS
jgi:hypothetical protein